MAAIILYDKKEFLYLITADSAPDENRNGIKEMSG